MIDLKKLTRRVARHEDGFTMIIAILVMFVTSLIVAGVFVAANGDVRLTKTDTSQKKAYYAALAGISAYKYHLNKEPNYWKECPTIAKRDVTPGNGEEEYQVRTVPSTGHTEGECKSKKNYDIIESSGSATGTFRIESTGTSGSSTRSLVATFEHPGFLNYVYFTKYEVEDPTSYPTGTQVPTAECEHYYSYRKEHSYTLNGKTKLLSEWCVPIQFAPKDKVNGPLHTDDAADVCGEGANKPTFGRRESDKVEMNGGHYALGSCSNSINLLGTYTEKAAELNPPETDSELAEIAGLKFSGKTILNLNTGKPNTLTVTTEGKPAETKNFPSNGILYVSNSPSVGCGVSYTPFDTNYTGDSGCGNVYVSGEYTESLTIASANDVIIDGNITTTTEASGEPNGSGTLGLIATNFVRLYHPVAKSYALPGSAYTPTFSSTETAAPTTKNTSTESSTTYSSTTASPTTYSTTTASPTTYSSATVEPTLSASTRYAPTLKAQGVTKAGGKCEPASEWESYKGTCYSKKCAVGTYYGEGKCATCTGEDLYFAAEKKCASSTCSAGLTYFGEGKCAKCNAGYEYLTSNKKCASTSCNAGDTFLGEGKCAHCAAGYEYISASKKCVSTTCNAGDTYLKEGTCAHCSAGFEYLSSNKKCVSTTCNAGDSYLGNGECAHCPAAFEYLSSSKKCANTTCSAGETYMAGEGKCAKCEAGFEYVTATKKCSKTSCNSNYTYIGGGKCAQCKEVEYNAAEEKCGKCNNEDQYLGSNACEYENNTETCKATNESAAEDTTNGWGSLSSPTIDAAILSTDHSFIVDNYKCGKSLGTLNIWGSIAQFWRGPVGTSGGSGTGYIKNYNYDERLATDQPPSFLTPSTTIWKITRVTAPPTKFTE